MKELKFKAFFKIDGRIYEVLSAQPSLNFGYDDK